MAVLLTRVKARMTIHAHRKVRGLLEGDYAALHAGRSMDFNDLREYVRGDDVKDIDWKASARSRTLLVKRYAALRQHTIQLVVSTGRSMAALNERDVPKRDLAIIASGVLGWIAVRHGDMVALVWGDADEQHQHPPARGELGVERHLQAIRDATTPEAGASDLPGLLEYVVRTVRRRTLLFVICDAHEIDDRTAAALRRLSVQHEVLMITAGDLDPTADDLAPDELVDVDTGQQLPTWLRGDAQLQQEYADLLVRDAASMKQRLDALGIVHVHVPDERSTVRAMFDLLETHRHARRR